MLSIIGSTLLIAKCPDEIVPLFVLLRVSALKDDFESIVHNLDLTVTAHATGRATPSHQNGGNVPDLDQIKVVLDSRTTTTGTPFITPDLDDESTLWAIWKEELHIRRPPQSLNRPAINFTASAVSRSSEQPVSIDPDDEYLSSGVPASENLVQALQSSPAFAGQDIRVPLSRIQKVTPGSAVASTDVRLVRGTSRFFPVMPALNIRTFSSYVAEQDLISIDLEVARWANCDMVIDSITSHAFNIELSSFNAGSLPQVMRVGDRSAFIFQRSANPVDHAGPTRIAQSVQMHLQAHAVLNDECKPRLDISWALNTAMPPTLNQAKTTRQWTRQSGQISRPTSLITPAQAADQSITFAFSSPPEVHEGETFKIDVLIVNRGNSKRRLALIAIPETPRSPSRVVARPRHSTSAHPASGAPLDLAPAVLDERSVYRMSNAAGAGGAGHAAAQIASLNADAKIGPLLPGACHTMQLEFLALSSGLVGLDSINVVDVDTRESVRIVEVPDIVAFARDVQDGRHVSDV